MRRSFSLIFWGLVLLVIDFSINGFDLFPDGVGYGLAAIGGGGLIGMSRKFSTARAIGWILATLWCVGFFVRGPIAPVFGLVVTLLNCFLIWHLLGGIADGAKAKAAIGLAKRAETGRVAYVSVTLIAAFIGYVSKGNAHAAIVLTLMAAMFVAMLLILHVVHRAKNELTASPGLDQTST